MSSRGGSGMRVNQLDWWPCRKHVEHNNQLTLGLSVACAAAASEDEMTGKERVETVAAYVYGAGSQRTDRDYHQYTRPSIDRE